MVNLHIIFTIKSYPMIVASLRRKYTHNVLAALLAAGMLLPVATRAQGFLKASGHIIVDGSGHKYILRGMGLGGWMLQEGYMFRVSNLGRQYIIKEKIQELVGPEKT